jgi:hypothetical protein
MPGWRQIRVTCSNSPELLCDRIKSQDKINPMGVGHEQYLFQHKSFPENIQKLLLRRDQGGKEPDIQE